MENKSIIDTIEPDLIATLAERKKEIDRGAGARPGVVAALALGSVPIAIAALSRDVYGASVPTAAVKAVLDFAFALEVFEDEFYLAVLGKSSNAAANTAFAPVRAAALTVPGAVATLTQIEKHEAAHRTTLIGAGATNVFNLSATSFDFTGGRGASTPGPFAGATTSLSLLLLVAQGAEDTGVRAYKGQAGALISDSATLEAALRIHSVEARHASRIRRLRRINAAATGATATTRFSGTVRGGGAGAADAGSLSAGILAAFGAQYGAGANPTSAPSESNVIQGGVDVSALAGAQFGTGTTEAAQEAFDEPLDRPDVIAIVQPFFIPTIS